MAPLALLGNLNGEMGGSPSLKLGEYNVEMWKIGSKGHRDWRDSGIEETLIWKPVNKYICIYIFKKSRVFR